MNYEILLYPRTPGQDWAEVVAADEDDGPQLDQAGLNRRVAAFRRIEAGLREQLSEPVRTWVAEELDGDILGQFQTRDSGLRVELYDRSASVAAPRGGSKDPVRDLVRRAVEVVAAETGYEAYDPQRSDSFDGTFDEEAAQAQSAGDGAHDDLWAHGVADDEDPPDGDQEGDDGEDGDDQDTPEDPRAERARLIQERRQKLMEERNTPSALRRRGWFYVVFGVLMAVIGGMRISAGQTDLLTWLFLGFGAFELVGAWMLFSQASRAQIPQADGPGTVDAGPDSQGDTRPGPPR